MSEPEQKPKYKDVCEHGIEYYLGTIEDYNGDTVDVYWRNEPGMGVEFCQRYSDDGPDYMSGPRLAHVLEPLDSFHTDVRFYGIENAKKYRDHHDHLFRMLCHHFAQKGYELYGEAWYGD